VAVFSALLAYVIYQNKQEYDSIKKVVVFKSAKNYSQKRNSLFLLGFSRKVTAPVFLILMVQESNQSDQIWMRYDQNGHETPAI
jgi:hypothetical protein